MTNSEGLAQILAQLARLDERIDGIRADVSEGRKDHEAMRREVAELREILSRARGAAWALGALAGVATLFFTYHDKLRGFVKGWLA